MTLNPFTPDEDNHDDWYEDISNEEAADEYAYHRALDAEAMDRAYRSDGFDGLGICPNCHDVETPGGKLCLRCRNEARDHNG